MARPLRQRAREAFATALRGRGEQWQNAANSVAAGYENIWVTAGLDALEPVLRGLPDEGEDDDHEARAA